MSDTLETRETFVVYLSDWNCACSTLQRVSTRDPLNVVVPRSANAFYFCDVVSLRYVPQGETEAVKLQSEQLNKSPTYYVGAKIYTLGEAERAFPNDMIVKTLERDGFGTDHQIIRCRNGTWKALMETDVFLDEAAK